MKENSVTIFGGKGKMGEVTNTLFRDIGFQTEIVDPQKPDSLQPIDAARKSDVIFFSVDPAEIPKIISAIDSADDQLLQTKMIIDNTGIKTSLKNHLMKLDLKGASICSTHPLFGPTNNPKGETVLIIPFGNNFKNAKDLATKVHHNSKLVEVAFEDHDKIMVVQQLIPHRVMRLVGCTIAEMGFDFETLFETASANSKLFWISCARVNIQSSDTSSRIIKDLENSQFGKAIIDELASNGAKIFRNEKIDLNILFDNATRKLFPNDSKSNAISLTNGVIQSLKS